MSKVLVTLDFDGVVSPIDQDRDFLSEEEFSVFQLGAFPCAISKRVLEFVRYLKELSDNDPGHFVLSWATSWVDITEYFERNSQGAIPSFGYLPIPDSKARAIADKAIAEDASLILVLEDSPAVQADLHNIQRRDMRLSGRRFLFFEPKLSQGLQFSDIMAVRSLIAAELGKNS